MGRSAITATCRRSAAISGFPDRGNPPSWCQAGGRSGTGRSTAIFMYGRSHRGGQRRSIAAIRCAADSHCGRRRRSSCCCSKPTVSFTTSRLRYSFYGAAACRPQLRHSRNCVAAGRSACQAGCVLLTTAVCSRERSGHCRCHYCTARIFGSQRSDRALSSAGVCRYACPSVAICWFRRIKELKQ